MVKKDYSKLYTEKKLQFLKEDETVINLAIIMLKILSKFESEKTTNEIGVKNKRYESINNCLEINSEYLDEFESKTEELYNNLQLAKKRLEQKPLNIYFNNLKDVEDHFAKTLYEISYYINEAKEIIESIERISPELLYCFFNAETWGATWCLELYIPKKVFSKSYEEKLEVSLRRVLNLELFKPRKPLIEGVLDTYISENHHKLNSNKSGDYVLRDKDYFMINSRVCTEVFVQLFGIITNLRDACRAVFREVKRYRKEIENFNDDNFIKILKKVMFNLRSDERYNEIIESNSKLLEDCKTSLRLLYDYKRKIEENGWKYTMHFKNESEFRDDLFNYLRQVRGEKLDIIKEGQISRGSIDLLVNNRVVFELKITKKPVKINDLSDLSQIREYMANLSVNLGFLIMMDLSRQNEVSTNIENYFDSKVECGGMGISKDMDESPHGIITILIFGGEKARPSMLKK